MESANISTTPNLGGAVVKIVFAILGVVAIYYLYKYLFIETKKNVVLVDKPMKARESKVISPASMPIFVEGGEYTLSFWIYIQDMVHNNGIQKHVMTLGSPLAASTGFESIAVYLGATQPSLHIRTQNKDIPGASPTSTTAHLTTANVTELFNNKTSFVTTDIRSADIPIIDMQRWVNVTIVLNGRTTDVYMDGKLIRSSVNEGVLRVPSTGYQLELGYKEGFGGYISRLQAFDYALNPEEAYRIYTNGPHGPLSALDWLRSIFSPSEISVA